MTKLKKGFTLVELVIVIAVIAVLAAVLIPTFSGIVQRSRVAADQQNVSNINTVLGAYEGEKPTDMAEVLVVLNSQSQYTISSIQPQANGYYFAWNKTYNKFYIFDGNFKVTYPAGAEYSQEDECWFIVNSASAMKTVASKGMNIYLKSTISSTVVLEKWVSVDTGSDSVNGKLTIKDDSQTPSDATIILRGSFADVTVKNTLGKVEQYGSIDKLTVTAVASTNCFDVNGSVKTVKDIAQGKLVNNGVINTVEAIAQNAKLQNNGRISTVGTTATNIAGTVSNNGYIATSAKDGVAGGNPTTAVTLKVANASELQAIAFSVKDGIDFSNTTIQLKNNIDLTNRAWTPIGATIDKPYTGSFDGNGKTITGLSNKGYIGYGIQSETKNLTNKNSGITFGLFGFVKVEKNAVNEFTDVTFEKTNIDMSNGLAVGALIGRVMGSIDETVLADTTKATWGVLNISDITVNGTIKAMDKVGGVLGLGIYMYDTTKPDAAKLNITGCTNNANITVACNTNYARAGGIAGAVNDMNIYQSAYFYDGVVAIRDCENTGIIKVTGNKASSTVFAGVIIGHVNGDESYTTISGCRNSGKAFAINNNASGLTQVTNEHYIILSGNNLYNN